MQINMDINHLFHLLFLALSAVVVATFFTDLGANNAIGISAAIGLIVAYFIFKPKFFFTI